MAEDHEPEPTQQTQPENGEPVEIPVSNEGDLVGPSEPTALRPDPDKEHAWWSWWRAEGQGALTQLLRDEWNPIGSEDVPADEYASYATRLGGLLREGVSEDEIATFLEDVRTGALGLPAHPDEDRRVAALVHARYLDARRAAE
jgi:hypothetical protein